jgi:type I restriction enzyme M protein
LTPGRYVGIAEQEEEGEPFVEKMQRLTTELSELLANGYRMDAEIKKQLSIIGFEME